MNKISIKMNCGLFWLLFFSWSRLMAATIEISSPTLIETNRLEIGQTIPIEVRINTGDETITGYSIHLSYDPNVISVDSYIGPDGEENPFLSGDFLNGIVLQNTVRNIDGKNVLSYVEAVGGAPRKGVKGEGVVARINFTALRRVSGDTTSIFVQESFADFKSHYVSDGTPGREMYFVTPIQPITISITGFSMDPLPDLDLIDGKSEVVFDLDQYVDTLFADVVWTNSRLSEISTFIDEETNEVTMKPENLFVGKRRMIFTAYDLNEGISVSDTISLNVRSVPIIKNLPNKVEFLEDGEDKSIDLDSKVTDLDDDLKDLVWEARSGEGINVTIDPISNIVTFTSNPDYFGNNFVEFFVIDSFGLTDSLRIPVEVTPVNDTPEAFAPTPIYPVINGPPVTVPLKEFFMDVDDSLESLQIFLEPQDGVSVELSGDNILFSGNKLGRSMVTIHAQDISGMSAETRQIVFVLEEGQSIGPELAQFPSMRIPIGGKDQLSLTGKVVDDQPEEEIVWSVEADSGFVADISDEILYVAADYGFRGMGELVVTATDSQGNFDREKIMVYVQDGEDSLGPIISFTGKIGLRTGEIASFFVDDWVDDPDHQDSLLNWTFVSTSGIISQYDSSERELFVRAEDSLVEPASITLSVSDPDGNIDETTLPVLFARNGEPPKLAPLPKVNLEQSGDEAKVDLDDFAYDDMDRESELIWEIDYEPGVNVSYNPISHDLLIQREDIYGLEGAPLSAQVLVKAQDTSGLEKAGRIDVGLPPIFEFSPLPTVELYSGNADSSLLLNEYVISPEGRPNPVLIWSVDSTNEIAAEIDSTSKRLHLRTFQEGYTGSQNIQLRAMDSTGRIRTADLRVIVKGLGLPPQLRSFPRLEIQQGNIDSTIDLDDYVVDDNPDSKLIWNVTSNDGLHVSIDPETRILTIDARETQASLETLKFIVRDPAGNVDAGSMEVGILRGGKPPKIGLLPQIVLKEGGREQQVNLVPYITDEDTPTESIKLSVEAEAGVAARISDGQIILSIPGGQRGSRLLNITATDPQGNADIAELKVLIDQDDEVPELTLDIVRHPIFSEELGIFIYVNETLVSSPSITVGQDSLFVEQVGNNVFKAALIHPSAPKQSVVVIEAEAQDLSGNIGVKRKEISLAWMDEQGGNVRSPDPEVMLNVSSGASRAGQLAVVYKLDPQKTPEDSEGEPVFSIDLERGKKLKSPVTVNFLTPSKENLDFGLLRWDDGQQEWIDLPTSIDPQTGWLSTTVEDLGLFRKGVVSPENRLDNNSFRIYPNPWRPDNRSNVRVDYRVKYPGQIQIKIFNALGSPIRILSDEYQEVGAWSVQWDGLDDIGQRVASGVYYFELQNYSRRERAALVLIR